MWRGGDEESFIQRVKTRIGSSLPETLADITLPSAVTKPTKDLTDLFEQLYYPQLRKLYREKIRTCSKDYIFQHHAPLLLNNIAGKLGMLAVVLF